MGLIFKRPNTRQPQGVVQLDGQNPLTQRPAFVWVPNRNRELVQQSSWSLSGSTPPTIVGTPGGVATKHTSGASTVSYVDLGTPTASVDLGTVPSTYVGVFYASAASGVAIAERNDANAVNIGWVLGYVSGNNAGTYGLGFVQEHSTTNSRKSISNAVVSGLNVLVVTYDGGLLASGINVYLNGVLGTVNGSQDGVGTTGTDAARNLYVGRCSYDTSRSHNGTILLAGAFKRIWSAAEVLSFSRNPWQIFQSPPRELQLDVPSSGTVALTGVSGTGTAGTVGVTVDKALTGNTGTGSVGTVSPATAKALTGNSATGSVGTVTPSTAKALTGATGTGSAGTASPATVAALTGVSGTGSVGTVGVNVDVALTGVSATGTAGTVGVINGSGPSVALTGVTGTGSAGTVAPAVDKALTGVSGTGSVGTVAPSADKGITGNSATGSVGTASPAASVALTATTGTGSVGTTTANVVVGLSGVSATGTAGTVTAVQGGTTVALTGVTGTGSAGQPGLDIVIALSGVTGTGSVGSVSLPSSAGGNAWDTKRQKKRQQVQAEVNARNLEILRAELVEEARQVQVAVVTAPVVAQSDTDDDEEDVLMLLL